MSPVGAIIVASPPKTWTSLLHPLSPLIVGRVLTEVWNLWVQMLFFVVDIGREESVSMICSYKTRAMTSYWRAESAGH